MNASRISGALIAAAVLAAVSSAVIPPLLLGIPLLWFITPPLGILAGLAVLLKRTVLLLVASVLSVLALGIGALIYPMRLSQEQKQRLTAVGYLLDGQTFFSRGAYSAALAAYEECERAGLQSPSVAYQRAQCYNYLKDHQMALGILGRLKKEPYALPLWITQIDYAVTAFQAEEYEEGKLAFEDAISYNLSPGYSYYQLGIYYRRIGNEDSAAMMFTDAHRLWQYRSDCSLILAKIAESRRDYKSAEKLYRRALRENVENLTAYTYLGNLLFRQNRVKEAEELMKKGLDLLSWKSLSNPPETAEFLNAFGYIYAQEGRLGEAEMLFKLAITNYQGYMEAYLNLAQIYAKKGRLGDAQRILEGALLINPGYTPARGMLDVLTKPIQ